MARMEMSESNQPDRSESGTTADELADTQASRSVNAAAQAETAEQTKEELVMPEETEPKSKPRWRWWVLLGLLGVAAIAILSGLGGYNAGIDLKKSVQSTQIAMELERQFELGEEDLRSERYEIARQRFDYILKFNPNYPGAIDRLTEALLAINITATPTIMPTATLTPTPDLRSQETLFSQAQAALESGDWTAAIDALLALRKADPTYNAVQADGMFYIALRNRGVQKILRDADLEGGTFDLALAEKFGPLDAEAKNLRSWVDLYVIGASFWEIDWSNAVFYFGQVAPMAPNLRDASGWTATQRYLIALLRYGDLLAQDGKWCKAAEQYQLALSLGGDPAAQPTQVYYDDKCSGVPLEDSGDTQQPVPETPTPTAEGTPYP